MIVLSTQKVMQLHRFLMQETSIEEKAAKLGVTLTKNHAFLDGNKRIGAYALLIFLDVNGVVMEYSDADLIALGLGMADGTLDYDGVLDWIQKHKVEAFV